MSQSSFDHMITSAIHRFPKLFDERLQRSWYQLLANYDSQFFKARSANHLKKILLLQFFLKKKIETALEKDSNKRHVFLRGSLISTSSFAIAITISQLESQEQIDHHFILSHLSEFFPGLQEVPDSFFTWKHPRLSYSFYYIEIQKLRGKSLILDDIKQIQSLLLEKIPHSTPTFTQPVFWPLNEEEAYRQLFFLKQEIKSSEDCPQVSIHFHVQDGSSLEFLVYLTRPQSGSPLIPTTNSSLKVYSRLHTTFPGSPKVEGYVLSFIIPSDPFNEESMIHLLQARRRVARHVEELIGLFRDCNGGLLEKQQAALETLKSNLTDRLEPYLFLAEKLYYSIQPIETRISISSNVFNALLNALLATKSPHYQTIFNGMHITVIKSKNEKIFFPSSPHISLHALVPFSGWWYLIILSPDSSIPKSVAYPSPRKTDLRIAFQEGPLPSLHPHYLFSDMRCLVLCKVLFEGCTRLNGKGEAILTGAETIKSSSDHTSYLISLRKNQWSNGEKVTAFQYEKSWKKALLKNLHSHISLNPFSLLKNAQKIWNNHCSINDLGVRAIDESTLKVELEFSCPNFTKFLSHPVFSPVYSDSHFPKYFNGPFLIQKYTDNTLTLEKNPHYFNASLMKLQEIKIDFQSDPNKIFSSFQRGEYDWVGEPFSRLTREMIDQFKQLKSLQKRKVIRPFWLYLNTKDKWLKSKLIRQAIAHCIDRISITQNSLIEETPLYTPIPTQMSSNTFFFPEKNPEKARALFKEGLRALGYTHKTPPSFVIRCCNLPGFSEFAQELQKSLEEDLSLFCHVETMDWNQLRSYLDRGDFQIAGCTQMGILNDPLEFLGQFAVDGITNFSKCFNSDYQRVLDQASVAQEKTRFLKEAEKILTIEMPFIPIADGTHLFAQNPKLKGGVFDASGCIDLSYCYFEE